MRKYKQVALVVKDVEKTMKFYWDVLGIGPWDVRHFKPEKVRDYYYMGQKVTEDFEFVCAVCWEGDPAY
jgi:methylmalonyl-CoA/ethylmalonyl-CoA epimerase